MEQATQLCFGFRSFLVTFLALSLCNKFKFTTVVGVHAVHGYVYMSQGSIMLMKKKKKEKTTPTSPPNKQGTTTTEYQTKPNDKTYPKELTC